MKYGILGAGPSGLSMALFLKDECLVLEKESHPGGHASSFKEDGFTFDYGPHIMFSKNENILRFMVSSLGKNVMRCKRNNKVWYKDRLLKYPFENDLASLPWRENLACLLSYLFNSYKKKYAKPQNLREWLLYHFGKGICEKYLFPYNKKVWHFSPEKLSLIWAGRIPLPPAWDIVKSALGFETEGYLHQLYYYYPLKGGYQAISEAWASKVAVRYNFMVKKVEKTRKGKFIVSDGQEKLVFDQIISTIPIQELIKMVNIPIPSYVQKAIKGLIVNPTYGVCLGIKGEDENKFTAVYFPDSNFWVNRMNFPKTFSPYNAPAGAYSLQADITCRVDSKVWREKEDVVANHVVNNLIKRGFIRSKKDIVYKRILRSKYAYVVSDVEYEKNTKIIREWFPQQGIHLVGRFSYFEYINVDGVVARSLEIASLLNNSAVKLKGAKIIK